MLRRVALCAVVLAGLTLPGCHHNPKPQPPAPAPAAAPPPATTPAPPPPPPPPAPAPRPAPTEDEIFRNKTLDQLNAEKPLTDSFFAYDSTELTAEARGAVQKDVDWMKRWTTTKVMVEGHADSRGTNEYNLALGERRANSVRDYLVSRGISAERLTTVSYGEERPKYDNAREETRRLNRRAALVVRLTQ
jgi:peptidoglycan-associated lipoprotein